MKIKKGLILRSVGGENVVVPVGEMTKIFHGMITLNETGAFLWNFFCEEHTIEDGIIALCKEYEAEESLVKADVEKFVRLMEEKGLME